MGKISESIYNGKNAIIPLADVQHIEPKELGLVVVTRNTVWDIVTDNWSNNIWIDNSEADYFKNAWCRYRRELESLSEHEEYETLEEEKRILEDENEKLLVAKEILQKMLENIWFETKSGYKNCRYCDVQYPEHSNDCLAQEYRIWRLEI